MSIDFNAIDELIDHVVDESLLSPVDPGLLMVCAERLCAAGIDLLRANLSWRTLHPTIGAATLTWWKGRPFEGIGRLYHAEANDDDWRKSPGFDAVTKNIPFMRVPLEGDDLPYTNRITLEMKEAGGTEYLLSLFRLSRPNEWMGEGDGLIVSWTSGRKGGFTSEEVECLKNFQRHLALALKVALRERITLNTLNAYLGENAASQVLKGAIRLGDGQSIEAVIWFSDLRQSTDLGDRLSGAELITALNDYFSCSAGAVMDHGGEVLRFIGDGVLAIFPYETGSVEQACKRATAAAQDALSRLEEINQQRGREQKVALAFGVGLHVGELIFGNIGVAERMDFSVTGPAANEVARIETLTKEVGYPVLASADFAQHAPSSWKDVGAHPLRGVERKLQIFALDNL